MFNYLALQRNLIPLGLYRLPGSLDNTFAYTFTNPPKNVHLNILYININYLYLFLDKINT